MALLLIKVSVWDYFWTRILLSCIHVRGNMGKGAVCQLLFSALSKHCMMTGWYLTILQSSSCLVVLSSHCSSGVWNIYWSCCISRLRIWYITSSCCLSCCRRKPFVLFLYCVLHCSFHRSFVKNNKGWHKTDDSFTHSVSLDVSRVLRVPIK